MSHYQDIKQMLSLPSDERPTVFFCSDDGMAYQVQTIALSMGLNLPGNVEIVGFGNTDASRYYYPIATVEQHFAKIGAQAFHTVLLPMGKK